MAELEELLTSEWDRFVENALPAEASPLSLPPERRVPLRPVALFAQLEEVREDWRALTSDMGADELSRYINAAWTLKELLAHVANGSSADTSPRARALRTRFSSAASIAVSSMGSCGYTTIFANKKIGRGCHPCPANLIADGVSNAAWVRTGEPSPGREISQDALHAAEGPRVDELDFMAERFETSGRGFVESILHP